MRFLPEVPLQLPPDEQVEFLVGAAELHVRLHRHRIVALHQRIQQLVDRNRLAGLVAPAEVVALEQARHGVARGEPDHSFGAELVGPFRIEQHLRLLRVEYPGHLRAVGLRVLQNLLAGQRRAGLVLAGRVPDHPREVSDQELHRVPEVLKVAHLVDHHGVAEVQVRCGRIEAELDAKRPAGFQLPDQLLLGNQLVAATLDPLQGFCHRGHWFCGAGNLCYTAPAFRGFGRHLKKNVF